MHDYINSILRWMNLMEKIFFFQSHTDATPTGLKILLIVLIHRRRKPFQGDNNSQLHAIIPVRGSVSLDLRELSIELLGSIEEKEQFFKEFEMASQLVEF